MDGLVLGRAKKSIGDKSRPNEEKLKPANPQDMVYYRFVARREGVEERRSRSIKAGMVEQ